MSPRQLPPQSEDTVSAGIRRDPRGRSMPETGVYIPSYKGINQQLYDTGESSQINFMNALAGTGEAYMEKQQMLYDQMEIAQTVAEVDNQYRRESEQYLQENPSGQGYTEYITSKYHEATQQAVSGKNERVSGTLNVIFSRRRSDVANNAFQVEKETYTAYAINSTQTMINETLNEVMLNPNEVSSLEGKLQQQLSGMSAILSGPKFTKYSGEKKEDFTFFYGLGLIQRNPYQAKQLLQGDAFVKGLPPERFLRLQRTVDAEIDERERKRKEFDRLVADAQAKEHARKFSKAELDIMTHALMSEETILNNSEWSDTEKTRLISKLRTEEHKTRTGTEAKHAIDNAISNNTPSFVSASAKEKYLYELWQAENTERSGASMQPLSYCEKIAYLQDHAQVFDSSVSFLQFSINDTIRNSKEEKKVLDACLALSSGENVPALRGMSDRTVMLAETIAGCFEGSLDLSGVIPLRDKWLQIDDKEVRINEKRFGEILAARSESSAAGKRNGYLQKFYDDFDFFKGWWIFRSDSPDRQMIDDLTFSSLKKAYSFTGDETFAKNITASRLKKILRKDGSVWRINPPLPENTGLTEVQIKNITAAGMQKAAIDAAAAGFIEKDSFNFVRGNINPYSLSNIVIKEPRIKVKIPKSNGDEIVERELFLESASLEKPIYNVYYLFDEKNPTSREYLYARDNTRCQVIFSPADGGK